MAPQPTDCYPRRTKGLIYVLGGGMCFYLGCVFLGACCSGLWDKWYFGVPAIVSGASFLWAYWKLVEHGIELVG